MKLDLRGRLRRMLDSPLWFLAALVLFIGFVGPALISAAITAGVVFGIILALLLGRWAFYLFVKETK